MTPATQQACHFVSSEGKSCRHTAEPGGELCFWHDPKAPKAGPDIKLRLETEAKAGHSLEGYQLQYADLRNIWLTPNADGRPIRLSHADLSRCNLQGGHLFNLDLRGSTLLKADLSGANLNRASLEHANVLGVILEGTKLEQVSWGHRVRQEDGAHHAHRRGQSGEAYQLYGEAEEVYRTLSKACDERGYFDLAGDFLHRELVMRRMQMRRWTRAWLWSKLVDMLCGYGERTDRVIGFSLTVILGWALLYFLFGVVGPEGEIAYNSDKAFMENLGAYLKCVYYSVITFTTAGFGDILPVTPLTRTLAAMEAFTGAFAISLFVVVFVRKMTR
ncbi:MAG: pentapeptide repeat-containing protein [Candidatus Lambdaproteobacteria bacterium]|nr:pentapeptide repeat-containing protein [Candidatus Lambdaproteobacteria bacterium]